MNEKKENKVNEKALAREQAKAAKAAEKERLAAEKEAAKAAKAAEKEAKKAAKAVPAAPKDGEPPKKKSKAVKAIVLTFVIVLALAAIVTGTLAVAGDRIAKSDKIFPGVTVGEIPLGGLTENEAVAALEAKGWVDAVGGTLHVTLPLDVGCQLDYIESGASLSAEKAAAAAWRWGRSGDLIDALRAWFYGMRHTTDVSEGAAALDEDYIRQRLHDAVVQFDEAAADQGHNVDRVASSITLLKGAGEMIVDEEELYGLVTQALEARETELSYAPKLPKLTMPDFDDMHEQLAVEPQNARYDPDTETIEPEIVGIDFDVQEAAALWEAAKPGEFYTVPVTLTYPEVTEESMSKLLFRDLLGECTTSFWGSTANRINNIQLVADKLDGLVIQPGEEFSYNGFVGERTTAAGFKAADAYANGTVRQEIGGGICQVSSTLYNAALASQLEITDRTCHMYAVGYLRKGLDATVSWPGPDFKFKNCRDYPVRLKTVVDTENTKPTIQLWGSNLDGTYAVPGSSYGKLFDKDWEKKGYEVHIGWWARSWLDVYDASGKLIETRKGFNSLYDLHPEDIKWPEVVEEKPEDTSSSEIHIEDPTPTPPPDPTPTPPPDPTTTPPPDPDPTPGDDDIPVDG